MKVSPAFSKAAGCRGGALARAPQSVELSFCSHKRRRGFNGEPSPGVPPFLYSCACAPLLWAVVVALSCLSTPFLWCLPKETVSSRQRKALFLPRRLHHPRERCQSVDYTLLARLWAGAGAGRGGVRVTAQKEGPPDGGLSSQYLKSCAFSRTMSLTFMRRTLVEFSFSSSFMVM